MHFSWVCWVMDPQEVYSLMGPYDENDYEYECDDCMPFRDWFEIGWRRAGIIKLKNWCKWYTELYDYGNDFKEQESKLKKWSCSIAQKKDIDHFYKWERDCDAYPHTRMFFDENWEPNFQPEEFERDNVKKATVKRKNVEKEVKEYYEKLEAWYENVPDDYYIVIIDYHD